MMEYDQREDLYKVRRQMAESVNAHAGSLLQLLTENIALRRAASALWDGITDMLEQSQIDRIERLYREELAVLLRDEP